MLNGEGGGVVMSDGRKRKYKIMLLAGGDLIESFGEPGVWSEPDVSEAWSTYPVTDPNFIRHLLDCLTTA